MSRAPEFEVTVTIRNNRLKSRRDALGFTQAIMAAAIGIPTYALSELERISQPPVDRLGYWTKNALAIADYFEVDPEELWPDVLQQVTSNKITKTLSSEEIKLFSGSNNAYLPPAGKVAEAELRREIELSLTTLYPIEQKILRKRFGLNNEDPRTTAEIAKELKVTEWRVRQIEEKALHRMRFPQRSHTLRQFIDVNFEDI